MPLGMELEDSRVKELKRMAAQFVGQMPLEEADQREIIGYMLELVAWEAASRPPTVRLASSR